MAEQSDAAKRAAARKAKILARGNAGLQRLAQTARGDEADALYGDKAPNPTESSTQSSKPNSSTSTSTPSWAPPSFNSTSSSTNSTPGVTPSQAPPSNPSTNLNFTEEQQRLAQQIESMMSMFGGSPGAGSPGGAGGAGGAPDMNTLLSMFGGGPGGSGMGFPGQNLIGDLDDPAGLGTSGGGAGLPPNFPNLGSGIGVPGFPNFPGMSGGSGQPSLFGGPAVKSKAERWFPIVHSVAMVVLVAFIVGWWEPALRVSKAGLGSSRRLSGVATVLGEVAIGSGVGGLVDKWGSLSGRRGAWGVIKADVGGVQSLPVFWTFITFELILQTTRFTLLRSPPPPHSLLSNFLPLLPPGLAKTLVTASRYLSFGSQVYKDGCLLIWSVGMVIVVSDLIK